MDSITEKKCTKCGGIKPITEFHKDKRLKSGHTSWCELCNRQYHKQYYRGDKEKIISRAKKYYENDRENKKINVRAWAIKNPERRKSICKKWRDNNKEQSTQAIKEWKNSHPEKVTISSETRRIRILNAEGTIAAEEWTAVLEKYHHTCLCCGKNNVKLTMDHVVPVSLGGAHSIENIQPLCQSCNSKKYLQSTDYREGWVAQFPATP
jgi:5-methylcytosine-specific restriction endonuclease McrA